MKKIFAILVLMLLVFSIVPVFAQEETDSGTDETSSETEVDSRTRTEIRDGEIRTERKEIIKTRVDFAHDVADRLKEAEDRHIEARLLAEERLELFREHAELGDIKERFNFKARILAEERIKAAKDRLEAARIAFDDAKEEIKAAKDALKDAETDEEKVDHGKDYLIHILGALEEHLNKVLADIEENEHLTDEEAAELTASINARLTIIAELRVKIDSAETRDELKDLAAEVRVLLKNVKDHSKIAAGRAFTQRLGGIIVQSAHLEAKLDKVLERMANNGIDTSEVEPLVEEFSALVNSAKENFDSAIAKFKEASNLEGEAKAEVIVEAQASMRDAKSDLKEARAKLKEITRVIKAVSSDAEDILEEETEESEAEDTEAEESDETSDE